MKPESSHVKVKVEKIRELIDENSYSTLEEVIEFTKRKLNSLK